MNVRKVRIGDLPVGTICVSDFWGFRVSLVVESFDFGIVHCYDASSGCKIEMFDDDLVEV